MSISVFTPLPRRPFPRRVLVTSRLRIGYGFATFRSLFSGFKAHIQMQRVKQNSVFAESVNENQHARGMAELTGDTIALDKRDRQLPSSARTVEYRARETALPSLEPNHVNRPVESRHRAGHPGILCYTIGNEIPASIVRWHGRRKLERFLERLYWAAKAEDPECLVTYVNYPSTEYLQLSFLDFACFNVYLESQKCLDAYLGRLHNIAGDRPLVMAEMGLDSHRNGEITQAHVIDWQIRTVFADGGAGVFVYAWTDEWFRGGAEVEDWKFGLTDRNRDPKPALSWVRNAFREIPFARDVPWPRVSVVLCSYNGARTIRDSMEALQKLEYPNYEVIVVDDGSKDATAAIASEYDCRVIRTENCGLGSARNTGCQAATGDLVAYIDDDAYPDPHCLHYLASAFLTTINVAQAAVGGPNIAP